MAQDLSELLEVHVLAREAGLWRSGADAGAANLMVVPLFETIDDLGRAPDIMARYFAMPEIGPQVAVRGHQEVMIGYSDSNKDRSEEHTSELQSLMRISYAVFCLKKKNKK